jgi:hypothetical protein
MWLSLIWTKEKSSVFPAPALALTACASSFDEGTPPAIVQSRPVPAHAMHPRKFRLSIPSLEGCA